MTSKILTIAALSAALAVPALANKGMHSESSRGGMMHSQSDITSVQEKLNERGYDVGTIDGKMGKKTSQAIKKFQKDEGLSVTGTLDQSTYAALNAEATDATGGEQAPDTRSAPSDQTMPSDQAPQSDPNMPSDQMPQEGVEREPGSETGTDTGATPDTSGATSGSTTTTPDSGSETKQGEGNY